mgnify:CR=1 FL=1|jgi:DNA phosphorothioation-dependent restriction protein DptG
MENQLKEMVEQNGVNLIVMTPEQVEELVEKAAERANERNRDTIRTFLRQMRPTRLLSSKETAELLHVTTKTLCDWKKSGKLVPIEVVGRNRYKQEDIEEFMNRR